MLLFVLFSGALDFSTGKCDCISGIAICEMLTQSFFIILVCVMSSSRSTPSPPSNQNNASATTSSPAEACPDLSASEVVPFQAGNTSLSPQSSPTPPSPQSPRSSPVVYSPLTEQTGIGSRRQWKTGKTRLFQETVCDEPETTSPVSTPSRSSSSSGDGPSDLPPSPDSPPSSPVGIDVPSKRRRIAPRFPQRDFQEHAGGTSDRTNLGDLDVLSALSQLPHDVDISAASVYSEGSEDDASADDSNRSSSPDISRDGSVEMGGSGKRSVSSEEDEEEQRMHASDSDGSVESDDVLMEEMEECPKLYTGSKFTLDEAVLDIVNDFHNNHVTKRCLKAQLKTFSKHLPPDNIMPKSVHRLFKYVENQAPTYVESAHPYCRKCLLYQLSEGPCELCSNSDVKYFYSFSLEEQIRYYFEYRNLAKIMDAYKRERQISGFDGVIRDFCDGSEYKRVQIDGSSYQVTLISNTDGVNISRSSESNIWPVLYSIAEVPPSLRLSFLVVQGVWCDEVKPPMNTFLNPLVGSLRKIHDQGGVTWTHPELGSRLQSPVVAPFFSADAPARAELQNIEGHNSMYPCNTCEQKTELIPLTNEEIHAKEAGQRVSRKRRLVFQETDARIRDEKRMKSQAVKAAADENVNSVKGVRGLSIVGQIPNLDVSTCVIAEYMHGVCLGVVRQFMRLWLNEKGEWNEGQYFNTDEIDDFMKNIRPSSKIGRLPRPVTIQKWKASEYRAWLLFYSPIILSRQLPYAYFQHWILLVKAVYMLLQEKITEEDLRLAETMLRIFVRDIGVLYGQKTYVYNVHQLLHLPLYVRRWGPLWATSTFQFENYNGFLVKLIHGSKNPAKELCSNLRIAHGLQILRTKLYGIDRLDKVGDGTIIEFKGSSKNCSAAMIVKTLLHHDLFEMYMRARISKEDFTSSIYKREKSRNNYTVYFESNCSRGYGEIKCFVKTENSYYIIVNVFEVNQSGLFVNDALKVKVSHVIPILTSDVHYVLMNASEVRLEKVNRVGMYICRLPNSIEVNL